VDSVTKNSKKREDKEKEPKKKSKFSLNPFPSISVTGPLFCPEKGEQKKRGKEDRAMKRIKLWGKSLKYHLSK
jgi:hypothetical protein